MKCVEAERDKAISWHSSLLKKHDKLQAELARRDAAAGEPVAWLNDAYLGRGVLDGELGKEDQGPGYIPVYRVPPPAALSPEYHAAMKKLKHTLANCNRLNYCADALQDVESSLVLCAQEKPSIEVEKMNVERQALICWLKNEINLIESARDEIPFGLDADGEMALKGIRTALSALEAKPFCYTGSGSMEAVKVGCEGYIWRDCENSHPIGLYTTPPAASAPDGLAAAVNRLLDSDGSRGTFSAIRRGDALADVERLLTASPAPGGDGG